MRTVVLVQVSVTVLGIQDPFYSDLSMCNTKDLLSYVKDISIWFSDLSGEKFFSSGLDLLIFSSFLSSCTYCIFVDVSSPLYKIVSYLHVTYAHPPVDLNSR